MTLMAKQTVALEVLSYHATAQEEETNKLTVNLFITVATMFKIIDFIYDVSVCVGMHVSIWICVSNIFLLNCL